MTITVWTTYSYLYKIWHPLFKDDTFLLEMINWQKLPNFTLWSWGLIFPSLYMHLSHLKLQFSDGNRPFWKIFLKCCTICLYTTDDCPTEWQYSERTAISSQTLYSLSPLGLKWLSHQVIDVIRERYPGRFCTGWSISIS